MKRGGPPDFGLDYFSPIGMSFQDRKSKIKTICFKVCSRCGETKLIFKFPIDKRNTDGRVGICKECRSKESLRYYYQNRERILIQVKEYQKTNKKDRNLYFQDYRIKNKKHLKELAGEWYKSNRKKIKKRNLKYYQENLVACQIRRKLWIEKNKERIREYNREYKRKRKLES